MKKRFLASLLAIAMIFTLLPISVPAEETPAAKAAYARSFVPANVVRLNVKYQYSSTGGLAGVDAAAPAVIEGLFEENGGGDYEFEFSLPQVGGFRIVLDPTDLNAYLVNPPTGNETAEELQSMLERGDFDVDVDDPLMPVYYEQENPDGGGVHPVYGNRYSTQYNQAWNDARVLTTGSFTAQAYCGSEKHAGHEIGNHGANPLESPRLKVTLNEEQLESALENGLDITVNYRRNATWYTVNHWVPEGLSGLDNLTGMEMNEIGGITYVLRDAERKQGRVGALTRAAAMTGNVYDLLEPLPFSQQLVINEQGANAPVGTTVDIYYKAAGSYRVIFDTDYTYIQRQQVLMESDVDFAPEKVPTPQRKGYTFTGWQYLNKGAEPDENGEYAPGDYTPVEKDENGYHLTVDEELIAQKAQLRDTAGVQALHLYPIWEPETTQVTVLFWTEDLDGLNDVQAQVTGGTSEYYREKYQDYQDEVTSRTPNLMGENPDFSNAGSFTMTVGTDSPLTGDEGNQTLADSIQKEVTEKFGESAKDVGSVDASQFYTQCGFSILHESGGSIDYGTTTANADGRTMIYVYFTRKIYTLKFHYYGEIGGQTKIATGTNGYSWGGGTGQTITDASGELDFGYNGSGTVEGSDERAWSNSWQTVSQAADMPVPQTITIRAKYGADLREVWPVARAAEKLSGSTSQMVSWAATAGKYCKDALNPGSSHYYEATLMGLYASMDGEIIADPLKPDMTHHLVAYWSGGTPINYYRYNHCYELPGLELGDNIKAVTLYGENPTILQNVLYLVPADDPRIAKFGFTDLLLVSYDEAAKEISYSEYGKAQTGGYYAVRGYTADGATKYYAVGRRIETVSTNAIAKQNPSARTHMDRVNQTADHTTEHEPMHGQTWSGQPKVGEEDDPYGLYFYYDRDRYTITYMAPKTGDSDQESAVELGRIELPYGAHVTKEQYAFELLYTDTNQATELTDGVETPKYRWSYPDGGPVAVCQDRDPNGQAEWRFKGWALGPAGANMLWTSKDVSGSGEAQAQINDDFYIGSKLLLYAIWETPMLTVTFHLGGGVVSGRDTVVIQVPANSKITDSGSTHIPRPLRSGYTMRGWYQADQYGTPIGEDEEDLFNFDAAIIADQDVAAVWTAAAAELYSYNVYYVTESLRDGDTDKDTVQIDADGGVVTDGGTAYYLLGMAAHPDELYVENTVLNLTARGYPGYTPRETNKTLELENSGAAYDIVFYYDPQTTGSHTVRFVEAGTENAAAKEVRSRQIQADQTVATPYPADVQALTELGYELVKRNDDGTYAAAESYDDLTWLDESGQTRSTIILTGKEGSEIPTVITYLVRPMEEEERPGNSPSDLNSDDHYAYIVGYPDGTVQPGANITRAETAAIFFRLLKPEVRQANLTEDRAFADVKTGKWYSVPIATMARLGVVQGRAPETFSPDAPITRAEFAAICARFDIGAIETGSSFTDISGHWAEAEIQRAASLGWVAGYPDGSFRPDSLITRAEAVSMINRVLRRLPESDDDLLSGMKTWPDNPENAWYYLCVQEATSGHSFERKADGVHESWTGLLNSSAGTE